MKKQGLNPLLLELWDKFCSKDKNRGSIWVFPVLILNLGKKVVLINNFLASILLQLSFSFFLLGRFKLTKRNKQECIFKEIESATSSKSGFQFLYCFEPLGN